MKNNQIPEKEDRYFSRAVSNALKILDLLRVERSPLGLSDITRKTGINKTSAFRFLYTMQISGHVTRDTAGRYSPSGAGLDCSSELTPERIRAAALPHMRKLRSRYGETVSLGVRFRTHIEVVEVMESPHLIRMSNRIGAIIPPHASSLGKAIAAFQDEEMQERLLNSFGMLRLTEKTILDETHLRQEYARIRSLGWSHDNRESAIEGQCFGVPVIFKENAVAAVSISFPVYRVPGEKQLNTMLEDIKRAAVNISSDLEQGS